MDKYLPTGNDFVSLPRINERTGGIEDITFLYMAAKGLIDIRGSESTPLIQPYVHLDGDCAISPACLAWTRLDDWLPQSTAQLGSLELKTLYMPPIDERGFAIQMTVHNTSESAKDVVIGLNGCWASSWHCVNEDKPLSGKATCFRSGWNSSLIFEYHAGFPMFSFAPMADVQTSSSFTCSDDGSIAYDLSHHCTVPADGTTSVVFYWGLGFEEVAAATSAKEMLRQTFNGQHIFEALRCVFTCIHMDVYTAGRNDLSACTAQDADNLLQLFHLSVFQLGGVQFDLRVRVLRSLSALPGTSSRLF